MQDNPSTANKDPEIKVVSKGLIRLRALIEDQRDLPPLREASEHLARTAASQEVRVGDLVDIALMDPAIVVRLLRIVNGSAYETRDRADVVCMQRAISLIGHQEIGNQADNLKNRREHRHSLTPMAAMAIGQAIFAARFAQNLLDTRNPMISDEGAVTVFISHLPTILCAMVAPDEACALKAVRAMKPRLYDSIFRELLGVEVSALNRKIVETWALPQATLQSITKSRQRQAPVMAARDWLPIAVALANEISDCVRIEQLNEREERMMEIVRKFGAVMDIDSPRLSAMIEQTSYQIIGLERSLSISSADQVLVNLLQPTLRRTDSREPFWWLPERLDVTGIIGRVQPTPRPSIYPGRTPTDIHATNEVEEKLKIVKQDMSDFIPHFFAALNDGLFQKTEAIPGETITRHPSNAELATSRIGPFMFDGLRMAVGYDCVSLYLKNETKETFNPAWISPEPTIFNKGDEIRTDQQDLISKASNSQIDAQISNCKSVKIQDRLPTWFRLNHEQCRSFVFLPLSAGKTLRGFIIAENFHVDNDSLSKPSMILLREIRDAFNNALKEATEIPSTTQDANKARSNGTFMASASHEFSS